MSHVPTREAVEAVLAEYKDPETGRDLVKAGQVHGVEPAGDGLAVRIGLSSHSGPLEKEVREEVEALLRGRFPGTAVEVTMEPHARPPQRLGEIGLRVKSVIAVGSGKGGVGKSTIAASLAFGLKRAGCRVGLVDADVYGPSIPHLLGLADRGQPAVVENRIQPIMKDDLPVMSIGFLVPADRAVIWRGPMLHGAITNFLRDTEWGELDYLIIDMPPGTGDIALTLSQLLPISGAVVVCTPQEVALLDAVKAIAMFRTVNIPIAGVVENMSGFVCPECNKRYDIFGSGGARKKAEELDVPFLGDVPILMPVREQGDAGRSEGVFDDPQTAPYFERISYQLAKVLATRARQSPPQPSLPVLG